MSVKGHYKMRNSSLAPALVTCILNLWVYSQCVLANPYRELAESWSFALKVKHLGFRIGESYLIYYTQEDDEYEAGGNHFLYRGLGLLFTHVGCAVQTSSWLSGCCCLFRLATPTSVSSLKWQFPTKCVKTEPRSALGNGIYDPPSTAGMRVPPGLLFRLLP